MNRVMIAGTNSGVGKTTVSIGIMAALKKESIELLLLKQDLIISILAFINT